MNDEDARYYGGPSWKWMVTMVAGIMVPLIGAILVWIASTMQTLTTTMPTFTTQLSATTKQLDDIRGQLASINTTLIAQQTSQAILDTEYKALLDRMTRVEDLTGSNADWIDKEQLRLEAHNFANRGMRAARSGEKHD